MGAGLRAPHYTHILETLPEISWFEAISENYMGISGGSGGRPISILEKIRAHYPIVLHGVSLSLGSTDPLSTDYLKGLKSLCARIEPEWVSDHLCWTGVDGTNLHDLLPLPYTEETVRHVVSRVERVQDFLGRRILLENVSSYLTFEHSEMPEWDFLREIAERADCGILLDINNIYVSSVNHRFDPYLYLDGIPGSRIGQFHLAGHQNMGDHLIDTHDHPVCDEVWKLYGEAVRRFGAISTLLEWDDQIPEFSVLEAELAKADQIQKESMTNAEAKRPTIKRAPAMDALGSHRP
jgi:uncharacterized protein (UPF0276 family)